MANDLKGATLSYVKITIVGTNNAEIHHQIGEEHIDADLANRILSICYWYADGPEQIKTELQATINSIESDLAARETLIDFKRIADYRPPVT